MVVSLPSFLHMRQTTLSTTTSFAFSPARVGPDPWEPEEAESDADHVGSWDPALTGK